MNWYRAKTILIVFFVCMNVFLLVNLIYTTNKANIVTPEVIASTVEVLEKNNIHISAEKIPEKTISLNSFEMKNVFSDKEKFAKNFCGEDAVLDAENIYKGKNGTISYESDRFIFTPISMKNSTNGKDMCDSVKILLSEFGIDVSDAECIEYNENGNTVIHFKNTIDGYKIFDSYIKVFVDSSSNITCIDGAWFEKISKSSTRLSLKSVTSVLVDFILNPKRTQGENIIEKLELGYVASDDGIYHESTVLIPVWQITLTDGSSYCMDTRG